MTTPTTTTNVSKRNIVLMWLILMCTITIIYTNNLFNEKIKKDISNMIIQNEYEKIWWKENYLIMQELQKNEIIWYIEKIKKEKPDFVKEILEKHSLNKNWTKYKYIDEVINTDLKNNTSILWSQEANISIIEFSDLECPYCILWHKENNHNKLLKNKDININYIFKHTPLKSHKNAQIESIYSKCVEKLSNKQNYFNFIDYIFSNTEWWWEWIDLNIIKTKALSYSITEDDFNKCIISKDIKNSVINELNQWRKLWISAVPATMILNNSSWKYTIISWKTTYDKILEQVNYLK
jgi:protein-disulfide isomerase